MWQNKYSATKHVVACCWKVECINFANSKLGQHNMVDDKLAGKYVEISKTCLMTVWSGWCVNVIFRPHGVSLKHDGHGTVKMANLPVPSECDRCNKQTTAKTLQTVILKLRLKITYTYLHHYYIVLSQHWLNDNINSLKQIHRLTVNIFHCPYTS